MIGCKVMRTLASVEFEIILILGLPCCLSSSSSSACCLESISGNVTGSDMNYGYAFCGLCALCDDQKCLFGIEPYRHAYLVETETPKSPHTVASPTPLPDSTPPMRHAEGLVDSDMPGTRSTPSDSTAPLPPDHPLTHASPTLVPILHRTARMAVHVLLAMLPSLSASIVEVEAMPDLAFHKRVRSSYESLPSSSPPDLPLQKRYRDSDSESGDTEDEGPPAEDEDPVVGDEGLAAGDEGPGMRDESLSLGGDDVVPEAHTYYMDDTEDGITYIDVPAYPPPTPSVQTLPSPEWSSGSLPVSLAPSLVSSPMIQLTVPSPVASPATAETEGFLTELGARVEMQEGFVRDHTTRLGELSPALFERYDRDIRELLTRAALWHAISDTQRENQELRLRIAEERRARLDLAEIVDSMRRGQEPRGHL
ncbi:hypothetical protein Tco_0121245 [Tanacetum coccineum]